MSSRENTCVPIAFDSEINAERFLGFWLDLVLVLLLVGIDLCFHSPNF